jgi:hypothetical protein
MIYFNDVMKIYIAYYLEVLGFDDVTESIESGTISSDEIAARLVEFSEKLFAQGAIDAENEIMLGTIDVDLYDIEKTCVAICSFVEAQGYGHLINMD